jgi:hypothetical protein
MNRCLGTKRDNSPCTVTVEPPKTYCWWDDAANAETRKQQPLRAASVVAVGVHRPSLRGSGPDLRSSQIRSSTER